MRGKGSSPGKDVKDKGQKLPRKSLDNDNDLPYETNVKLAPLVLGDSSSNKDQQSTPTPTIPSHTKFYEYTDEDGETSPTRKSLRPGAFRYEQGIELSKAENDDKAQLSPTSQHKKIGLAFNYVPGHEDTLKKTAQKLKSGQLSPIAKDKFAKEHEVVSTSIKDTTNAFKDIDPIIESERKRSYSPSKAQEQRYLATDPRDNYTPLTDLTASFLAGEKQDSDGGKKVPITPKSEIIEHPIKDVDMQAPILATSKPKKRRIKIMIVTSKMDPNTKRIDIDHGHVENIDGVLDTDTGLIETKYGIINPQKGIKTFNQPDIYQGEIDSKTNNLHLTNGVTDPKTGLLDASLGQIMYLNVEDVPIFEIAFIKGPIDPSTGNLDVANGELEYSVGTLNSDASIINTKYGEINTKTGELRSIDSKTGKPIVTKNVKINPVTGQVTIFGLPGNKNDKVEGNNGILLEVGQELNNAVPVISIVGKYDAKRSIIEPKTCRVEQSEGRYDFNAGKLNTKYGTIDLLKQQLITTDPKNGKPIQRDIKILPNTGHILLKHQLNPKNNKPDKDYVRIISIRLLPQNDDLKGMETLNEQNIFVDQKTNQLWLPTGSVDQETNQPQYVTSSVDPKTGFISSIYSYMDSETKNIHRPDKIDENLIKVEPTSGKLYVSIGKNDTATGEPLYASTQTDPDSGNTYTKVVRINPKTGRIVIVRILFINKLDDQGRPEEVDPATCEIDPVSGRILKLLNKTIYVYNMIDPVTGEVIQVDPNDPSLAGARTTVTQTMTLTGDFDPITGRIKSDYGDIDPNTGDIDPATAIRDPVTGKLILNYAQIEPSHFGKQAQVSTVSETVPITREQFFEGVKSMGKQAAFPKSKADELNTDASHTTHTAAAFHSSDNATKKGTTAPKVVQTTTKQVLTKDDNSLTHNVEEQICNLDTGEIKLSTQEHKVKS